jgi:hypothetical protein
MTIELKDDKIYINGQDIVKGLTDDTSRLADILEREIERMDHELKGMMRDSFGFLPCEFSRFLTPYKGFFKTTRYCEKMSEFNGEYSDVTLKQCDKCRMRKW